MKKLTKQQRFLLKERADVLSISWVASISRVSSGVIRKLLDGKECRDDVTDRVVAEIERQEKRVAESRANLQAALKGGGR